MRGGEVLVDYKFKDIISNCCERIDPSDEEDVPYVGLEHINPDTFNIPTYGKSSDVKGQKFKMKKGDVLFGRRRAYQRKVAIAPFDGIFSAHGMIFRPKDVIDEELLPFFIRSDAFMDKAISLSVGSLSPTLNWGAIKDVSFSIPSKELQPKLSSLLWKIENDAILLKEQISFLDVLVKSRFIEMFGTLYDPKVPFKQLGDVATYVNGYAFKPSDWGTEGLPIIRIQNLSGSGDSFNYYSGTYPENIVINKGDVMISWSATLGVYVWNGPKALLNQHIFKVYFDKMDVNPTYFHIAVKPALEYSSSQVHGSTMTHLTKKTFDAIKIAMPPIDLQNQFAAFVEQIDKSKFELQKHLEDTKRLQKALINQAFSPRSAHD